MTSYRIEVKGKRVGAPLQYRRVKANALALAESIAIKGNGSTKVFELPRGREMTGGTEIASFPVLTREDTDAAFAVHRDSRSFFLRRKTGPSCAPPC